MGSCRAKEVKQQIHTCRDDVDLEQKKRDYKGADKRVKTSAKENKKKYLVELVETVEKQQVEVI
jgi:hypothetical protein